MQWYFRTWKGHIGWVAEAKREPFVTDSFMDEPGDLWFEFGDTEEEALTNLKRSLLH